VLDNIIQFTTKFSDVYSPVLADPIFKRVEEGKQINLLIVGGGDGRVAWYIKQNYYNKLGKLVDVEIDVRVSELCKQYFPETVCFEDPKIEFV